MYGLPRGSERHPVRALSSHNSEVRVAFPLAYVCR